MGFVNVSSCFFEGILQSFGQLKVMSSVYIKEKGMKLRLVVFSHQTGIAPSLPLINSVNLSLKEKPAFLFRGKI